MHSFIPFLSFLLSLFLLPFQFQVGFALAAELSAGNSNDTSTSRDLSHLSHNSAPLRRRHAGHAMNARSDLMLYPGRRAAGAQFTHFVTGLGACGGVNSPADFVVALDMQQFDAANHCNAAITITVNGKTAHATIVDRCVSCGYNNLDFTDGLMTFFDPSFPGTLQGDWEYGSGAPATTPTTTKPKPTPTPTPTPTPKPTSSSTSIRTTSSAIVTSASASVATTTSSISNTTTAAATASPQATDTPLENLEQIFLAIHGMGSIVVGSLSSSN